MNVQSRQIPDVLADGYFIKLLVFPLLAVLFWLVLFTLSISGVIGVVLSLTTARRSWVTVLCGLASLLASFLLYIFIPVTNPADWPWLLPIECNLLFGVSCLARFCFAMRRADTLPKTYTFVEYTHLGR